MHRTAAFRSVRSSMSCGHQVPATAIRASVSVPVLSVASMVTDPSVSTAARLRTMACRSAMRRAARARLTVTTTGSDSGTAATARLTAVSSISSKDCPLTRPRPITRAHRTTAPIARYLDSWVIRCCSGVGRCCGRNMPAIRPSSLRAPVAVTRARPRPWTTIVPE